MWWRDSLFPREIHADGGSIEGDPETGSSEMKRRAIVAALAIGMSFPFAPTINRRQRHNHPICCV